MRLGQRGLHSELFLAVRRDAREEPHLRAFLEVAPHLRAFLEVARKTSRELLAEIVPIDGAAQ